MRNFPLPHEKRRDVRDLHRHPKILLVLGADPFIQVPRTALAFLGTSSPGGWLLCSVRQRRKPGGETGQLPRVYSEKHPRLVLGQVVISRCRPAASSLSASPGHTSIHSHR